MKEYRGLITGVSSVFSGEICHLECISCCPIEDRTISTDRLVSNDTSDDCVQDRRVTMCSILVVPCFSHLIVYYKGARYSADLVYTWWTGIFRILGGLDRIQLGHHCCTRKRQSLYFSMEEEDVRIFPAFKLF